MSPLSHEKAPLDDEYSTDFGNWAISRHSISQFELRIDYHVDPESKDSQVKLESYFFIPESFRIIESHSSKIKFYKTDY